MRQNLDPLDEHSDSECDTVLQRVGGSYDWTLETNIEDGGKNLSQGQRQLVGLARAILRRSAIVILDEVSIPFPLPHLPNPRNFLLIHTLVVFALHLFPFPSLLLTALSPRRNSHH